MQNTASIILAGGLGKRMKSEIPKVLLKVKNKPMIIHVIEKALAISKKYVLVVVGRYEKQIKNCIEEYVDQDQKYKIYYVNQEEETINGEQSAKGTGHALLCCLPFLQQIEMNTKILVLSGDVPLINNELLLEFSNYNNALVVSEADDPTGYGRVFINTNGIPSIREHKFCKKNMLFYKYVNVGIYIFSIPFLNTHMKNLQINNSNEIFLTDLPFEEFMYWNDFSLFTNVNTIDTLNSLNEN